MLLTMFAIMFVNPWNRSLESASRERNNVLQLPYYIDGDVKLVESGAILRHIARQHDLCGTTEEERCRTDVFEYTLVDFRSAFFTLSYGPGFVSGIDVN